MKKLKKYKLSKDINAVKVSERIIPFYCESRRLGHQVPKYIIIHEVSLNLGRTPDGYNMEHYENKIVEAGLDGSTIGYHYLCGDKSIYHFIPDDEKTHHVGCAFNNYSIGIERLICKGVSYCDALHNQAKLTATLMVKHDIPLENVITHKMAQTICGMENPKPCPNRLIAGWYGGFELFKDEIKKCLNNKDLFYEILAPDYIKSDGNKLVLEKK